jgi:hypothetical protein
MDAHNEGILRAQKSARRRIVEEVRRKTAVEKLVRAYDANDMAATATDLGATQTTMQSGMLRTGASFYSQGSEGLADMGDIGCSFGGDHPDYFRQAPPPWIDEAHGARNPHMVSFRSPRQIKLQTEAEYTRSIAGQQKSGHLHVQSTPRVASNALIDSRPVGIQGSTSARSFPDSLPDDLPAALYLTMQQREQARLQKEDEQLARENGWRASHEVDPTPIEQRVYRYGDAEIKVGGRASEMVDRTVFEIRKEKEETSSGRRGNYDPQQGSWEESLRETMPSFDLRSAQSKPASNLPMLVVPRPVLTDCWCFLQRFTRRHVRGGRT